MRKEVTILCSAAAGVELQVILGSRLVGVDDRIQIILPVKIQGHR